MNKYKDPSHTEYMRQANLTHANKQTTLQSPFLISSLQPVTQNGRPADRSNGYTHTNGNTNGSRVMNININPLNDMLSGDVTAGCDNEDGDRQQVRKETSI